MKQKEILQQLSDQTEETECKQPSSGLNSGHQVYFLT